ncbi:hypothetical protein HYW74_02250 [Candidatus Pacearchaeota archaeon]|nr:hypothetical protein [Candidatus Pacearchaeota archaeon]
MKERTAGFMGEEKIEPNNSIYAPLVGKPVRVLQDNNSPCYGILTTTSTRVTYLQPFMAQDLCNIQPDGTTRQRLENENPMIIDTSKISEMHAIKKEEFKAIFLKQKSKKSNSDRKYKF